MSLKIKKWKDLWNSKMILFNQWTISGLMWLTLSYQRVEPFPLWKASLTLPPDIIKNFYNSFSRPEVKHHVKEIHIWNFGKAKNYSRILTGTNRSMAFRFLHIISTTRQSIDCITWQTVLTQPCPGMVPHSTFLKRTSSPRSPVTPFRLDTYIFPKKNNMYLFSLTNP